LVRTPDRQDGRARIVEEQRVAAAGNQQRDADVRAGPMAEMRVPELARLSQAVETTTTLSETVEVLLPREREPRSNARRAIRPGLDGHSARGGVAPHATRA